MSCPNCDSDNTTLEKQDKDGAGEEYERYSCDWCGCVWEWDMKRTIIEQGKEVIGHDM